MQVIPPTNKAHICPPCGESGSIEPKGGIEQNYNKDENDIKFLNTPPYPAKAVLYPQGGQICEDFSLDVSNYFDQINFEKLPNSFVIKCNHGCKWHYIIKNKEEFLNAKQLFEAVKNNITGWLEQEFWAFSGFEMQYATLRRTESSSSILGERVRLSEGIVNDRAKPEVSGLPDTKRIIEPTGEINEPVCSNKYELREQCQESWQFRSIGNKQSDTLQASKRPNLKTSYNIEPKIIIEPLMRDEINTPPREIEIYCFNGVPKIYVNVRYSL